MSEREKSLCSVQRCSILQSIYVYKRVLLDVAPHPFLPRGECLMLFEITLSHLAGGDEGVQTKRGAAVITPFVRTVCSFSALERKFHVLRHLLMQIRTVSGRSVDTGKLR